jgi:transposase
MAQNFVACDREQELLLPPSLREWLPEGHLAWFVIDAVAQLDLAAFYAAYRADGHGRAAHDPAMMVALLLYAYAVGERSSRRIERRCVEDVATRVICANQAPDHTTIARFRQRHETALAGLFGDVLALCAEAGLVSVGLIAIDGTKVHANASQHANRDYERLAREILEEADAIDAAEDERFGDARGDELPPELATRQGRRGWLREAKRRLDDKRAAEAKPIPRSRRERLQESKRRLEEEHQVECQANADYEAYRARGVMRDGRRFGAPPKPFQPPEAPAGKVNVTDPDSRNVKTTRGYLQGYNAQAAVNERQIVIAAEVNTDSPDFGHLEPMVDAAREELAAAGVTDTPGVVVADAGYWHQAQMESIVSQGHPGADPARRRQAQRHPTRLGRRPLRLHAQRARNHPGQRALPKTPGDRRADVRQHEVQPPDRPLPTPRQIRLPLRMATHHRHPQPPQAPHGARSRLRTTRRPRPPFRRQPRLTAQPVDRRHQALRNSHRAKR